MLTFYISKRMVDTRRTGENSVKHVQEITRVRYDDVGNSHGQCEYGDFKECHASHTRSSYE